MGILDIGAGAAEGLEEVLARDRQQELLRLQQREQAEQERSTRATEGFRDRQMQQQGAIAGLGAQVAEQGRRQQEQLRAQQKQNRVRDDARAELGTLPMGSVVPETERDRYVGVGAGAPARFSQLDMTSEKIQPGTVQPDPKAIETGVPASLAQNEPQYELQGTPREIADRARESHAAENMARLERDAERRHAEAMARADNAQKPWSEPTVNFSDPASGLTVPIPRSIAANPAQAAVFVQQFRAAGLGNRGAAENQKVNAYRETLQEIRDFRESVTDPTTGKIDIAALNAALGPFDTLMGSAREQGWLPVGGGGTRGSQIRSRLSRLRARQSFQEGGKQFTGTEAKLIDAFVPLIAQQPDTAMQRLSDFEVAVERGLTAMGAGQATEGLSSNAGSSSSSSAAPGRRKRYDSQGNPLP